jgi:hypothetical protein
VHPRRINDITKTIWISPAGQRKHPQVSLWKECLLGAASVIKINSWTSGWIAARGGFGNAGADA